jgi:hypothetical protein
MSSAERRQPDQLESTQSRSPLMETNELVCQLEANPTQPRWDCLCERRYTGESDVAIR